jgi:virginiamycin A acetyltransferase
MAGLVGTVVERLKLWRWRRDQFTNAELRRWFRERHRIDVGLYSYGCFDQWRMPGPLKIGRYCSIANSVRSAPINHPFDAVTTHPALYEAKFGVVDTDIHYDDPQVIEDDVWIGHNAMILPGCRRIGRGAIVGAGAVVTRDVPRYTIVAGNPARPLRERFVPEMQDALERSRWWEMDLAELRGWMQRDRDAVFHPTTAHIEALAKARAA